MRRHNKLRRCKTTEAQPILPPRIFVFHFNEETFEEIELTSMEKLADYFPSSCLTWIHIVNSAALADLENLATSLGIHHLTIEDILNTGHQPKMEEFEDQLFLIAKLPRETQGGIIIEQVSLLLGTNYVLSFSESDFLPFSPVVERLKTKKSKLRKEGADYLAYTLLDIIFDQYFTVLEALGESIASLEDAVLLNATPDIVKKIQLTKTDLLFLRKSIWPMREFVGFLERGDSALFKDATHIYLRDIYDHAVQIIEAIETYREILSGLLDIYLSSVNNRMSEIMKVLTVISTLFIPLTFLAGLEGMNFKYMPELEWEWGYPVLLAFMLSMAGCMITFFKRKKWL